MHDRLDLEALAALADRDATEGAAAGRLTPALVDALVEAKVFKLFLPEELGGLGAGLVEGCDVIARLAEADGSAGWAVMIGSGPNWFAGRMSSRLAAEVFAPAGTVVAGSGQPGTATRQAGGWRVSGTWPWCSGAPWATWFTFTAVGGVDESFAFAVPADQVALHPDTWSTRGLRATASWTAELDDVAVPEGRTFRLEPSACTRHEAVFRVPFPAFAHATMGAVAVGVARRLLREFKGLALDKRPAFAEQVLAVDPLARHRFGDVTASMRAAAGYVRAATTAVARGCANGQEPGEELLVDLQLAAVHATSVAARAGWELWELAGMSVLPVDAPLGRAVEDLQALSQNALIAPARFADAGAALLSGAPAWVTSDSGGVRPGR